MREGSSGRIIPANLYTATTDPRWRREMSEQPTTPSLRFVNHYSVKFVCGKSEGKILSRGHYYTAINVHNPTRHETKIHRLISVALPAETPGHVVDLGLIELHPDESFEIDCPDIYRLARMSPGGLLKGFVILESEHPLEVVAVYTASGADKQVETMHTERVPAFNRAAA
jgi:hypothetical protein